MNTVHKHRRKSVNSVDQWIPERIKVTEDYENHLKRINEY